ncbi:MAG: hypothetical protein M5U17_02025 [Ignavibacterium sp.]|nr:hypothetical protein [Ignavibacterium sp.]
MNSELENKPIQLLAEQKLLLDNLGLKENNLLLQTEIIRTQRKEYVREIVEPAGKKLSDIQNIDLDKGLIIFNQNQ